MANLPTSVVAFALVVSFVAAAASTRETPSPAASPVCLKLVHSMDNCLGFLKEGSKDTAPEGSCCDGVKSILKSEGTCVCEAMKSSSVQSGIHLNVSKTNALPRACGVPSAAPFFKHCAVSQGGHHHNHAAPVTAPAAKAPAPVQQSAASGEGETGLQSPAPSPVKSRADDVGLPSTCASVVSLAALSLFCALM